MKLSLEEEFSLEQTIQSGQVFRWSALNGGAYESVIGDRVLRIRQDGNTLQFQWSKGSDRQSVKSYFRLGEDYRKIIQAVSKDETIREAVRECAGLHVLMQEPWECLAAFLLSPVCNIPRIKGMIERLSSHLGDPMQWEGETYFQFPSPQQLSEAGEDRLRKLGTGFRSKNLHEAALKIIDGELSLDRITQLPDDEARELLMSLRGVGPKVADCVLLFAYDRLGTFPVDVWIQRVMVENYGCKGLRPEKIAQVGREYFGSYAGYAQQFLYQWRRMRQD